MYDQLYKTVICSWDYVEKFNTGGGTFIFGKATSVIVAGAVARGCS